MDKIFFVSTLSILLMSRFWINLTYIQILSVLVLIQVVRYLVSTAFDEYKYPPGPVSWPVVGVLPSLFLHGQEKWRRLNHRKYGPMVTSRVATKITITINGYNVMKEISQLPEFQDRPKYGVLRETFKSYGLLDSEGPRWKHQRRFMLHSLRDSGMGALQIEEKIIDEMMNVIEEMQRTQGAATSIDFLMRKSTCNVMFTLAFNKTYAYNDPQFIDILSKLDENVELTNKVSLICLFKWLSPLFNSDLQKIKSNYDAIRDVAGQFIEEHRKNMDINNPRDLLDFYLMEIDKPLDDNTNSEYHNTFTEKQLRSVILDLFLAGTETSSTTIKWAILYMILNPDIQKKVQAELDDVVGRHRAPKFSDRVHLPYTVATLQEVERMGTVIPSGIPRRNAKPATFKQYKFPANCTFVFNILAVHRDPSLWQDPEKFKPTRFIDDTGKVFRPPYLVPFGSGKRSCAGEPLARIEIFLMFTLLMQKFNIEGESNKPPTDDTILGPFRAPKPYKIRAYDRK